MKKYISVLFLLTFIIPSVAFASWWNPFTWKVFHKKEITPKVQVEIQKTPEEKISELQKQLDDLKNQKTVTTSIKTIPTVKEIKKTIPVIDNSAIIKAEIKARVDAELKIKAEQDALIVKQKEEEQARIDEQNNANLIAEKEKSDALKAVNLKIANLNAKYLKDTENCIESLKGMGATTADMYACKNPIRIKYENDFNILKVEFQQIKYND